MPTYRFPHTCALCLSVIMCVAAPLTVSAGTYTYDLTQSYADKHSSGINLTAYGGTRDSTGFHWSAVPDHNQGLTLDNVIGADNPYTIKITFSFDSTLGYARIVDFKDRQSDTGLYNYDGAVQLYDNGQGLPVAFTNGTAVDLVLSRSATGLFTVSVDGVPQISHDDSINKYASFTGTSIIFFMDNTADSNANEISGGTVTFIEINSTPIPAALPLFATGLGALGLLGWRRKRKASIRPAA